MATRIRTYKDLLTAQSDVENWFQKFKYHLLEQDLVLPEPVDPDNPTEPETTAINAMKRKIVIHLINSMDPEMFSKLKTLICQIELWKLAFKEKKLKTFGKFWMNKLIIE